MRKLIIILLALVFYMITSSPVLAEVVLDDSFTDTNQADLSRTTAKVDTINHYVELPERSLSNAVAMLKDSLGYAVASQSGVTLYELDDATGMMAANPIYSCAWATGATGVSIRQDNLNIWAISESSVAYYRYNGAGMSNDPALKVTGLNDVLSVAAFRNKDSALVLQCADNKAKITRYDAGGNLSPLISFEPAGVSDPVAVSMVNASPDFRLFTKNAAYYYSYDDAGGSYVEDPAKKVTGLANIISASSDNIGSSILTGTDSGYYINKDTGGASRVDVLSPGPFGSQVAVSLKPGSYEQALVDESGEVQWWSYDDAAGRMVRDSRLEIAGMALNSGYAHPKTYYSKAISSAVSYNAAFLSVSDDKPEGTAINYYVSSDGGTTFTPITPGAWTVIPSGASFVLRADLDTADSQVTPQIYRVILECDVDFIISGLIDLQPAERGRNVTISATAAKLTTGAPVSLDTCSVQYPLPTKFNGDPALPAGEFPTTANMLFNSGNSRWEYTFTVPDKTVDGLWSDAGVYQIQITGVKNGVSKSKNLDFEISGNILRRLVIKTINY
ncbi:MAG: hypothetical protein ACYDEQ_11595 [Desulfocucumaceae bacterium]